MDFQDSDTYIIDETVDPAQLLQELADVLVSAESIIMAIYDDLLDASHTVYQQYFGVALYQHFLEIRSLFSDVFGLVPVMRKPLYIISIDKELDKYKLQMHITGCLYQLNALCYWAINNVFEKTYNELINALMLVKNMTRKMVKLIEQYNLKKL